MNRKGIFLLLWSIFFNSCGDAGKEDDDAHQAQRCFNQASLEETREERSLALDKCLVLLNNAKSAKAYALRCAAIYIKQGILTGSDDVYDVYIEGNKNNLLGRLKFQDRDDKTQEEWIDEAVQVCEKSTVEAYSSLVQFSKFSTLLLGEISIDTENGSKEEIEEEVKKALKGFEDASDEKKEELGKTAKAFHQNECKESKQASTSLCKDLDSVFNNLDSDTTNIELADLISEKLNK